MKTCGTTHVIFEESEWQFYKFILSNRFEMYDLKQSIAWFEKPIPLIFLIVYSGQLYQMLFSD